MVNNLSIFDLTCGWCQHTVMPEHNFCPFCGQPVTGVAEVYTYTYDATGHRTGILKHVREPMLPKD